MKLLAFNSRFSCAHTETEAMAVVILVPVAEEFHRHSRNINFACHKRLWASLVAQW